MTVESTVSTDNGTDDSTNASGENLPALVEGANMATIRAHLPAVSNEFREQYPAFAEDTDIDALMRETLGEGRTLRVVDLTTIKVPSEEASKVFMVPDDNGDLAPARQGIKGIPVAWTERRSYWESKQITGAAPDCSSRDMENGVGMFGPGSPENVTGKCETCPMRIPGSAGTGTEAAACKDQYLLFLLTENEVFPYFIIFPPASLKSFRTFGAMLAKRGRRGPERPELGIDPRTGRTYRASAWLSAEIHLELEQDTNKVGVKYNYITIKQVRKLSPEETEWVNAYGRTADRMIVEQEEALLARMSGAAPGEGGPTDPTGGTDSDTDLGGFEDETEMGATTGTRSGTAKR